MKTTEYLDAVKAKMNLTSDYALAAYLGISRQAVNGYRKGKSVLDTYVAARVADALAIPHMVVIADVQVENEHNEKRRTYWENFSKRLRGVAASVAIIGVASILPGPVDNAYATSIPAAQQCILC